MNKRFMLVILSVFIWLPVFAGNWRVFVYMDSSDDLNDMAIKNITDMIKVGAKESVDFLIQLHSYDDKGLRYRVDNKGLSFLDQVVLSGNSKQDFIRAARWAFSDNNADHTMLICWNHGWGILDPHWDEHEQEWLASSTALSNSCVIKRSLRNVYQKHKRYHFMFSKEPRSYLTNQDLIDGLGYLKEVVLGGKKLDILAFDTCMGGMLEHAYQVAPYASYLIGNQACSLRDGFNYCGVLTTLNKAPMPRALAQHMVQAFDTYYKQHDQEGIYAHTALDLSCIHEVTEALNEVVLLLLRVKDFGPYLLKAHALTPRFCLFPMYTDLIAYIKQVEMQLDSSSPSALEVKQAMQNLYAIINKAVVARCAGHSNEGKAHGCAIYLPTYTIDSSYRNTNFARKTLWIKVLEYLEKHGPLPADNE